jgi:hypothetical protein
MTIKPVLFSFLTSLAATAASAGVYVDFGASKLELSGTPSIGDVGRKLDLEDLPSSAFTFTVGYELTPIIGAELRYTSLGDVRISKLAPSGAVFPGTGPVIQAQTFYLYEQSTQLYTLALPFRVVERGGFAASVTPLLHVEHSDFTFTNTGVNTLLLPGPLPIIYQDTRTKVHFGGEVKLAYRFNAHVGANVFYSYSALEAYEAQMIGAGLEFRF